MTEKITIRVNDSLRTIFNVDDPIYKTVICDYNGSPDPVITKPVNFNLGALTNNIEYLRQFSIDLLKQIRVDFASGEFLKYIFETFFNSLRLENESEDSWRDRTVSLIFQPRVSKASIIRALRPFSSIDPVVIDGGGDSIFADVSFADRYMKSIQTVAGKNFYVFPAYAQEDSSSAYSIIVVLYNTNSSDLYTVANLLNKYIAAGISFKIEIKYI